MKTIILRSQFYLTGCTNFTNSTTIKTKLCLKHPTNPSTIPSEAPALKITGQCPTPVYQKPSKRNLFAQVSGSGHWRFVVVGAASIGFLLFLMGMDVHNKALALGPEGPLTEEFWENVRRYALYALTVSTGALYTIFKPIVELLRNPISAVLILLIFGGSIYIISQVVFAMVGVTDFTYDYGY